MNMGKYEGVVAREIATEALENVIHHHNGMTMPVMALYLSRNKLLSF